MTIVCVVLGLWGIWDYVIAIPEAARGAARADPGWNGAEAVHCGEAVLPAVQPRARARVGDRARRGRRRSHLRQRAGARCDRRGAHHGIWGRREISRCLGESRCRPRREP